MAKEAPQLNSRMVGRLSLQTLTWLRDHQIPADPIAYSVGFEHNHRVIDELTDRIEKLEESDSFEQTVIEQLFREFILTRYIDFEGFNKSVTSIVEDTSETIVETKDQLQDFREFLQEAREKLSQVSDDSTKELILEIVENTTTTTKSVESLESNLHSVMDGMKLLEQKYSVMKEQAHQDQLTGLLNRSALQIHYQDLVCDELKLPITLCVADIDHFKKFNDEHGHSIGDKVIKLVAKTLCNSLKGSDIISRYGGEEFVILLPNTNINNGMKVMNSIREKIMGLNFVNKTTRKSIDGITMSFGLSLFKVEEDSFHSLFDRADKALYYSKENGRNQVHSED